MSDNADDPTLAALSSDTSTSSGDRTLDSLGGADKYPKMWNDRDPRTGRHLIPTSLEVPFSEKLKRFVSGYGSAAEDTAMGIGQTLGLVSRNDVAQHRQDTAPLLRFPEARAGEITGSIANSTPLAYIPGANTALGAGAVGALGGFLQPSASTQETLTNTGFGAALGAGFQQGVKHGSRLVGRFMPESWRGTPEGEPRAPTESEHVSAGSAASHIPADLSRLTDAERQIVEEKIRQGVPVDWDVLQRHIDARTLDRPVTLTRGKATRDAAVDGQEWNSRNETGLVHDYGDMNQGLIDNLNVRRDAVGNGMVHSTTPLQHGETMVNSIAGHIVDDVLPSINKKFSTLRSVVEANGNVFPIDGKRFVSSIERDLGPIKMPSLQNEGRSLNEALDVLRSGEPISAGDMLHLRDLASNYAASGDGKMAAIGKIILNKIDNAPLQSGTSNQIRTAWKDAIGAARQEFQMQDSNPWYKAIRRHISNDPIDGIQVNQDGLDALKDSFVNRHLVNSPKSAVDSLHRFLGFDEGSQRTMGVAMLDELERAAKIKVDGNGNKVGNFAADAYANLAGKLDEKLATVLDPHDLQQVRQLSSVARDVKFQDRSGIHSTSNTAPANVQLNQSPAASAAAAEARQQALNSTMDALTGAMGPKAWIARQGVKIAGAAIRGSKEAKEAAALQAELAAQRQRSVSPFAGAFHE